jgi:hypothetical protein
LTNGTDVPDIKRDGCPDHVQIIAARRQRP